MQVNMTAHFKVEGFESDSPGIIMLTEDTQPVLVTLATDGIRVMVERGPTGHYPALSPKGWSQLAVYAEALVRRANEAWRLMAAEANE